MILIVRLVPISVIIDGLGLCAERLRVIYLPGTDDED